MKISVLTLAALACLHAAAPAPIRVVVAKDGSGDYPTVQNAVDHAFDRVLAPTTARLIIEIRPGIYHERVRVPHDRPGVTFLGQDAQSTIITYGVGAKDFGGTFFSATVDINADEFEAQNITFENSYGTGTQAVAISVHSDRAVFRNCRFLGMQDTLYAASGRQYYVDSYIAGHVDFIFGNAAAVFDHCQIHSRGTGYVAAESRTMADGAQGFVFTHCRLTADAGVHDSWAAPGATIRAWCIWNAGWATTSAPRVGTTGTKKPPNRVRGLPNTPPMVPAPTRPPA